MTIVAIAFLFFLLVNVVRDHLPELPDVSQGAVSMVVDALPSSSKQGSLLASGSSAAATTADQAQEAAGQASGERPLILPLDAAETQSDALPAIDGDPNAWSDPYTSYIVTQGPHGQNYGDYAIDLTGGKGVEIYSPINGVVSALFIDQFNNTTILLENERYRVKLLHGNYTVAVGQVVKIGELIGTEWNNGYTLDGYGQLCAGRDCGYHTHLNVYDKSIQQNIDPSTLLGQ